MNLLVVSCMILPVWGALFVLYFILKRHRLDKESLLAKCAGTLLAAGSAGAALCVAGQNPLTSLVFWFFLLCAAADALIELWFLPGAAVFGTAHVCLIFWLYSLTKSTRWSFLIWAVALVFMVILFRRELPKQGNRVVVLCLYGAVLGTVLALSLPLPFLAESSYWLVALGALFFFCSDQMVAKQELAKPRRSLQKWIMLLYWGSLCLFSSALWLIPLA